MLFILSRFLQASDFFEKLILTNFIIRYYEEQKTYRNVENNISNVQNRINKYNETQSVQNSSSSGCPRKVTKREDIYWLTNKTISSLLFHILICKRNIELV